MISLPTQTEQEADKPALDPDLVIASNIPIPVQIGEEAQDLGQHPDIVMAVNTLLPSQSDSPITFR